MGKKFDKIYESVISVTNYGGYAPGYIVKFRPDYKTNLAYKALPTYLRDEVDELVNSGLNIKVVQVGHNKSGDSAGNSFKTADNVTVTVAADQGGGRFYGSVTVPSEMIDLVSKDAFTAPIPDQWVRDDKTDYKPRVHKDDNTHITRQTNKGSGIGGKNTPGNYSLPTTNVKLKGESARFNQDAENMSLIYEGMNAPDWTLIYENALKEEGFVRRLGAKLSGGFKSNPLQKQNQAHTVAKSVAYDVGKDISKQFGGSYQDHARAIYNQVLKYIKQVANIQ